MYYLLMCSKIFHFVDKIFMGYFVKGFRKVQVNCVLLYSGPNISSSHPYRMTYSPVWLQCSLCGTNAVELTRPFGCCWLWQQAAQGMGGQTTAITNHVSLNLHHWTICRVTVKTIWLRTRFLCHENCVVVLKVSYDVINGWVHVSLQQ